ncbi:radical SAM protein [Thermodesulfobacteriota bacterium]
MHYEGNIIRPPSEANSIILQVTVGCSHNRCSFCGAYQGLPFRIKENEIIDEDLRFAAQYCVRQKKVFLADGDVLSLSQTRLIKILTDIKRCLPWVNRVSLYGNAKNIRHKSVTQLRELKKLGLDRIYMGLESGHDPTLSFIRKGTNRENMIDAARRINNAGLFLSVTVLLGVAGTQLSQDHARDTGEVLTFMNPNQIGILTLMLLPGTPLHDQHEIGTFLLPDKRGILRELKTMIEHIHLEKAQIQTNHASNYLSFNCRFPRDKQQVLQTIDQALSGHIVLKPESLRAL